ncbi:MAG: M23 family metallopeptidase, partial [Thermodesulfovibrionales bacterium]
PHHGLDFSAPTGTPVSAVGEGAVLFSGSRGQYGKLVIVKHPNGWQTYYGHLSAVSRGIRRGVKVSQGQVIGRVGATGMATGPHLHYEVRIKGRPVNPLALGLPQGKPVPASMMADFRTVRNRMDMQIASMRAPLVASTGKREKGT